MIILSTNQPVTLHAAPRYPRSNDEAEVMGLQGGRNKEMRALTIAAFRIAQNNDQLSEAAMNKQLVKFLLANSDTAINYWEQKGRLLDQG